MAAAYAGLVSLTHILHQILNPPPNHHFNFPRERVESLRGTVSSIIELIETYPSRRSQEIEDLEARIVAAAHGAEEIIESEVVRQIQSQHANFEEKSEALHEGVLPKVMQTFISIKKDLLDIKNRKGGVERVRSGIATISSTSSTSPPPGGKNDVMVGFEEHMKQIRYDLASDDSKLLIVPIVGMGGIGKSTLARNAYVDPYITESFDVRAWVSISQEFKEREAILSLLQQVNSKIEGEELNNNNDLGVLLHKELYRKRYLIVLDDMWDIQAWDRLRKFLPDTGDGSRILVTTRLLKLANDLGSPSPHQMTLLDDKNSWNLVYEYVKEDCPIELEEIGKGIAKGCGGLPLALVVIGGLLAKSEKSRAFWEYVKENVSSTANYADDEKCIEILRLSYIQLPLHLKPCFLYLTMFPKTFEIRVSRLIRLWVAEGFIKPREGKSLEEVAEGYLKDLFDRNLIMIGKRGHSGKVKNYNIHDVVRDLCMSEAHKNKFLCIANHGDPNSSQQLQGERRLSIYTGTEALKLGTHSRSLLCYSAWKSRRHVARRLKLLRVLDVMDSYSVDEIMWLINSRYITCAIPREFHVASFVSRLWNIQTLVFPGPISLPYEFWQMPQLRHLKSPGITLTSPLQDDENLVVLENLQTLTTVRDFIYSENVLRRIPNLMKLGIDCDATEGIESFCLSNLARPLKRLESLVLRCRGTWRKMAFPISLKKLTLSNCQIPWEDMSVVGLLPNLEDLKLQKRAAKGRKWSPNEMEFRQLKLLLIDWCQLEIWEADNTHFPSLEHLQLVGARMQKFPAEFAEIATLRTIDLNYCSEALLLSAKQMSGERNDFGFEDIQIRSFPPQASRSRKKELVGMEDEAEILKGYLSEECEKLDVISIIGMGGLGKTTMARMLFHDPEIQYEFPIRVWITVSQNFSEKKAFLSILREFTTLSQDIYDKSSMELARLVSNHLGAVKFLVIMDDVWSLKDFDKLGNALPMNNKKSKILITSRLMEVCKYASPRREPHRLHLLTDEESWLLLQLEVFGNPKFPSELEVEGRKIADECMGLPLAVVLIGGAVVRKLSASAGMGAMTKALGEFSATLGARFSYENTLLIFMPLAYEILPYPLRKCFLYVGMFPEDYEIPTWQLLRMWIAEGFIDEEDNISLEETAAKYLDDLISSNLLIAGTFNSVGKVKTCCIHDIVLDFCISKASQENFFQEIQMHEGRALVDEEHKYQRLCIHSNVLEFLSGKPYCPSVRSFVCSSTEDFDVGPESTSAIPAGFKLLRVLHIMPLKITKIPTNMYHLLDLRCIVLSLHSDVLPAAFSKLSNLQTLAVYTIFPRLDIKASILNMTELRHFKTNASAKLPNPDTSSEGGENIQTLGMISAESCTEEVFDRARNLKKLGIRGKLALLLKDENRSFSNIGNLENLEKLKLINDDQPLDGLPPVDKFPIKLRSLTLCETSLDWSYMSILGSLENLEVLKLKDDAFRGKAWQASDGGFPHLEFFHIGSTDLTVWEASHRHFPKLKMLELRNCEDLLGVPIGLADVPSFQSLNLYRCSHAAASAQKIYNAKKKQEDKQFEFSLSISLS